MDNGTLIVRAVAFVLLVPAIVLHEVAHGYVAYRLGDPTAKLRGRLSLNPLKHLDLFGTILLPLLMVAMFGFGFGYAKPVPINPAYFRDYRKGMLLTGMAGPGANLALALAGGLGFRAAGLLLTAGPGPILAYGSVLLLVVYYFVAMNLTLMFFNLIPLPPLDGSRVLPLFLGQRALRTYARLERYGLFVLFGVMWLGPRWLGFDPFGAYFGLTVEPALRLLTGVG
jgi:Zn-dependent protease